MNNKPIAKFKTFLTDTLPLAFNRLVSRCKNFHVHAYQWGDRKERWVGTNRYIDGKEIKKKQYGYELICRCGKRDDWSIEWRDVS